ncbi:hypothetical protein DWUX_1816 [Desulfovibrio diazotrophicus]|nr:hypothetical protein DWUX_1816 [Desulfovibrio diazotrophicus]
MPSIFHIANLISFHFSPGYSIIAAKKRTFPIGQGTLCAVL